MTNRTALSALIKRYRLASGFSQEALAERAGLSARAISDLERGLHHAPHAATLDLLATALCLTHDQRALLLAAAHPELAVAVETPPPRMRPVPVPPTPLIGRERERARALAALGGGSDGRLLTLTGPSGVGKTRLALQVADDLFAAFPDGVGFVDLSAVADPALMPSALAQMLGLREQAGSSLIERVGAHLQDLRVLLVLDNFEHLLDAAPFVAELLARCPLLGVLVTSRAPLRLRAERILPLAPLALEDAVALFGERARAMRPEGTYAVSEIAAICERVDCLPLAIELAAAQIKMLSLPHVLERLTDRLTLLRGGARDLPARQQRMEDAIGWSYDLLSASQQRCFRALAVFVGGCTLEAARAVCAADDEMDATETFLTLAALVDASLAQTDPVAGGAVRLRMLELVREFALARLRDAGEEHVCRQRHAAYYARLAETAMGVGLSRNASDGRLVQDLPNARAALEWAEERRAAELGLRLSAYGRLWHISGQLDEAERWVERMLALDAQARELGEPVAPITVRITQLYGLGRISLGRGNLERAEAAATEAVHLAQPVDDQEGLSAAFATLGQIAQASGNLERAETAFTASLAHARLAEKGDFTYRAMFFLADLARVRNDVIHATALFEEALASAQASANAWDVAIITTMLGRLAHQRQHYAEARARFHESLALFRDFGGPTFSAWCLEGFAATLCAEEHHAQATRLCAAAAALRAHAQTPLPPGEREAVEHIIATARGELGEAAFHAEWAAGAAFTREVAIDDALSERTPDRKRAASGG